LPEYHLADGIILSIGPVDTCLVDLERDYEVRIDFRYVEALEKVTLGWDLTGFESFIPRLQSENILSEGKPRPDAVIRRRLETLDRMFMRSYEHVLTERARRAYDAVLATHARRKRFFERVGQCPVLPETALRRALLVGDAAEVGVKDVLCLGDDDLVCVALAVLGHRVTVYDIDDFLLNFLRVTCAELRDDPDGPGELNIDIVERDLRDPLKDAELEHFDVFLTDPMSNRDCFEIFLSRAFSLLKPGGVGYSAVYAPVNRLFREIAGEMKFDIVRWRARHNRYYSKYVKLHNYESDWVELRKTPETTVKHGPEAFSVPLNLYREDYHQRGRSLLQFHDEIEDVRFAKPLYLDLLLDALETGGATFVDRFVHPEDEWCVIHCPMPEGYMTILVDRRREQISIDMHPFVPEMEDAVRSLLMASYKTNAKGSTVSINRSCWDVRVR
jgi:predicted methyltransferase